MQLATPRSKNSLSVGYGVQVTEGVPNASSTDTAATSAMVLGSNYLVVCEQRVNL